VSSAQDPKFASLRLKAIETSVQWLKRFYWLRFLLKSSRLLELSTAAIDTLEDDVEDDVEELRPRDFP
jgi:hypothetical protein